MAESQLLSVKKLKSLDVLKNCLKHNLCQNPRELGGNRHIDPTRCNLNKNLVGGSDPSRMVNEVAAKFAQAKGKIKRLIMKSRPRTCAGLLCGAIALGDGYNFVTVAHPLSNPAPRRPTVPPPP